MKWYALSVETGCEELVRAIICRDFDPSILHAIVPKRRLCEKKQGHIHYVVKTMFPGYLLIRTTMNTKTYYKLQEIPKVYSILNNFQTQHKIYNSDDIVSISNIPEEEVSILFQLLDRNHIINLSGAIVINSRVQVKCGPLKGMEGIIRKLDKRKNRAKISLSFLGSERLIDVGLEILHQ
ncbi:antiterminator LoaP [Paenibacillus sp. MER 180]|uniref:antiterminator LoaP n=1 Tax=unclassified Paenibacillus TaxID=185978 RepID=UPI00080646B5|nr:MULTISPECIES: antiterminator LoaP [unclassified Paenibacillus]MCM3291531.1 antiterminator LoaP [Paenibacillus sp. MER 180]OBY80714.1 hypothetical protein BBG47_05030 [Paenibacillus sp. KS1]